MASIRRKPNSKFLIACYKNKAGKAMQRSTGIAFEGSPAERAVALGKAKQVAALYEEAARGNRTEDQIRKTVSDLFQQHSTRRLEWLRTCEFLTQQLTRVKARKSPATYTRYRSVVEDFVTSLGERKDVVIGDITPEDIERYVDQASKSKLAGTIRNELKILARMFAIGVRQGVVLRNPVATVDAPDEAGERKQPFTWEQIKEMVGVCDESNWDPADRIQARLADWRTAVLVGAYTGLRLGDAVGLKWDNLDLEHGYIRVEPSKSRRKSRKKILIPIHETLRNHFLRLHRETNGAGPIMPSLASVSIGGRSGLSQQFLRIIGAAGIDNPPLRDGLTKGRAFLTFGFHSFRHTFNTTLANAGVAQEVRMALVGHESERTNEIYTHRAESTLRPAVATLPTIR